MTVDLLDRPPKPDNRIIGAKQTEMSIEVRRGHMVLDGYCNDFIEAQFEFAENQTCPGHIEVPRKSKWASIFRRCDVENIFIHTNIDGEWWTGRVDRTRVVRKGRKKTVIAELVSDFVWLEAMMAWSAPFMPLWIQAPKKDVRIMPTDTMVRSYLFTTIFRLQANLYRFPIGFFNNPVENWWSVKQWMQPCVVIPKNPLLDTSRWNTLLAKMTPLDLLFKEVLKNEHLVLTAKAFVPDRDEQPSDLITLNKPCIVFDIEDHRSVTGATGTILDGIFDTIISIVDPIIGTILNAFTAESDKYSLAKFFGTDPKDPWVVIREDDLDDDIDESETIINSPQASTAIVGGHSPEWLNKGINLLINAALQGLLAASGSSFLGNLLNGELDDILMAYQSVTDERRRTQFGIFGLPEAFNGTGTTAFTFDAIQALRQLIWETRPYRTHSVKTSVGKPFRPFVHFRLGDPIGWEDEDEIYVDYVRRIVVTDRRETWCRVEYTIGDESPERNPLDLALERIGGVKQAFDFWTLSDN